MADSALPSAPYPGYTLKELESFVARGQGTEAMIREIKRRKARDAGDVSVMTPAERLRAMLHK